MSKSRPSCEQGSTKTAAPDGSAASHSSDLLRLAAITLGVTIGVQWTMAAFILAPKPSVDVVSLALSDVGREYFCPERETPIFIAGCGLSLLLAVALSRVWGGRLAGERGSAFDEEISDRTAWLLLLTLGSALANSIGFFPSRLRVVDGGPKSYQLALFILPGVVTLILGIAGPRPGRCSRRVAAWLKSVTRAAVNEPDPGRPSFQIAGRFIDVLWGIAVSTAVVLLVYVPSYRELAGRIWERDAFHHWDFFVMGPALGFKAGRALGPETYSQYGVGYPMLVNWISFWVPLSYGNLIHLGIIYCCFYFITIAFAIRAITGSRLWASFGMFLALLLQNFSGVDAYSTIWTLPSSSVLRYATDVWFFVVLAFHLRTGYWAWVIAAGVLAGVALLLVLDTGIYIFVTFVGYLACRVAPSRVFAEDDSLPLRTQLITGSCAMAATAATFLIGLAFASRGTLFFREFWPAYLEPIMVYSAGMSALPIAAPAQGGKWLIAFSAIVTVYLSCAAWLVEGLARRAAGPLRVLTGCIAAYGLGTMLLFVNRSAYPNLLHCVIPVCVLTAGLLAETGRVVTAMSGRPIVDTALGLCALLTLILFGYAINPAVHQCPNLLTTLAISPPHHGLFLMKDVLGITRRQESNIRAIRTVAQRMAEMKLSGRRVAVLDDADAMFYLASGVAPPDRYCPLLRSLITQQQVARAGRRFAESPADDVVMRKNDDSLALSGDAYREFRSIVERDYVLREWIGDYLIWSRPVDRSSGKGPPQARGPGRLRTDRHAPGWRRLDCAGPRSPDSRTSRFDSFSDRSSCGLRQSTDAVDAGPNSSRH